MRLQYVSASCIALCLSMAAHAQIFNGSFENGAPGSPPPGWTVTGGTATISATADDLFPSAGNQYLVLNAAGTGPSTAGFGPHAPGTCGQITQLVTRPVGPFCGFRVDWEFLPNESLPAATFNDYLSIDIVNNATNALIANVVFIDTGTTAGTPGYTNVPGAGAGVLTWVPNQATLTGATANQAPAGFKRAHVDLSSVPAGTVMRVEISVANVGDTAVSPRAYIDNVRLLAGERNTGASALRVLSSSHQDGAFGSGTWGGDLRPETPYSFEAAPGQRISFRADGVPGTPWALVAGTLQEVGTFFPGVGVANLSVGSPLSILINGFDPSNPLGFFLGTINSSGMNFLDAQIPDTVPVGASLTVQGIMQDTSSSSGFRLTAATTISVVAPQMPVGSTVATSASIDDGYQSVTFGAFGSWPFYGVSKTQVFVGSNGYLTFNSGDSSFGESEFGMMTGVPRIALVWDDLLNNATSAPVRTSETTTTFTASYEHTVEFANSLNGNNFSVQLYQGVGPTPAGVFTIYYGSTTMSDGLTGISPGALPAPAAGASASSNLSVTSFSGGSRGSIPAGSALLEKFAFADSGAFLRDTFDLMTLGGGPARITFVPNGSGGYTFFTGTR